MAKFHTYILLMTGLMLLFYFTGLASCDNPALGVCNPTSTLLNLLLGVEGTESSTLWSNLVLAMVGTAAGFTVAIGIITRNVELAVTGPMTVYLATLLWNFIDVVNKVREANDTLGLLLFAPVLFLFVIVTVEWWRGRN